MICRPLEINYLPPLDPSARAHTHTHTHSPQRTHHTHIRKCTKHQAKSKSPFFYPEGSAPRPASPKLRSLPWLFPLLKAPARSKFLRPRPPSAEARVSGYSGLGFQCLTAAPAYSEPGEGSQKSTGLGSFHGGRQYFWDPEAKRLLGSSIPDQEAPIGDRGQ